MDAFGKAQRREEPQDSVDSLSREPESTGRTIPEIIEMALAGLADCVACDNHAVTDAEGICRNGILRARIVLIP
jgi:hypothetical protein